MSDTFQTWTADLCEKITKENIALQSENVQLRSALEWLANGESYHLRRESDQYVVNDIYDNCPCVTLGKGKSAIEAIDNAIATKAKYKKS